MKYARIVTPDGSFLTDSQSGIEVRLPSERFKTGEDARAFLQSIEQKRGLNGLKFCCSHESCTAEVHFSKEVKRASGKRSKGREATWVSNNVKDHITKCPGPSERAKAYIPHNGLHIQKAAEKLDELIILRLNMELGYKSAKSQFKKETEDEKWRKDRTDHHSCFPCVTMQDFSETLKNIVQFGGKNALQRTYITHEGIIIPLSEFIVRNNGRDRLDILDGKPGAPGLYTKAEWRKRHSIFSDDGPFVFGFPRLVFFEAAQTRYKPHDNPKRVNGWRYVIENDKRERVTYDQLNLSRTGFVADDFFPKGGAVLARPFIHQDQNSDYPVVHWSIEGEENIDRSPSYEITKILCWNGQNIPTRTPRQMALDL